MPVLTQEELSQEFARASDPITEPFRPVRRLTALASEILRRSKNPLICGGIDLTSIMPKTRDAFGEEVENPDFSAAAVMELSRPIAEVIVVLSCPADDLFRLAEDPGALRESVNRIMADADDTEIIKQLAPVMQAVRGIRGSTIGVVRSDEEASLDPSKKLEPSPAGSHPG
jgi:hypothetical protein